MLVGQGAVTVYSQLVRPNGEFSRLWSIIDLPRSARNKIRHWRDHGPGYEGRVSVIDIEREDNRASVKCEHKNTAAFILVQFNG
jgi:hypothetical protein